MFRHTHISMLTEAGVDLPTIMKLVGHENDKTTTKIYTHVTKKDDKGCTCPSKKNVRKYPRKNAFVDIMLYFCYIYKISTLNIMLQPLINKGLLCTT
ncbi:tyrosine-type recombinase/integrase [Virgibacillus halophilus]|uniref:Tyrosine-type recombinase/integrase n=1 Tax=Tigheibacillus halophilus TaxID=361280 RepID=A0ABU5C7R4_9BACI|nr:tyrosine-type recombinase/integrase [Virgibacillus halophilus]